MNAQVDPNSQHGGVPPVPASPSFADEVRGTASQRIDLTLARIMDDLYDETYGRASGQPVDGWSRVGADQLRQAGIDPSALEDSKSGFKARIYSDDQGRYVLAYSGTDEGKDWLTNLGQGLGFESTQYNQAMALARQAKVAYGDQMVITGHSLGGGLAAAAAVSTDTPAVTFNAAGLHDRTMARIGLDPEAAKEEAEDGLIRRYAVKNEILTDLQEKNLLLRGVMPDAVGCKIELPDPDPLSFWQKLNPIKSTKHAIDMHYIEAVIDSMESTYGQRPVTKGLMSHPEHPLNGQYRQVFERLQPEMAAQGIGMRETQNVAGALALESHRNGIAPDQVTLGGNGNRAFVVQGDSPETQRYAQVDLRAGIQTPLADSSRQALTTLETPSQTTTPPPAGSQQSCPEPFTDLGASGRGR